ncbi:ABC transporter ATP-binding protein [Alsobacter sp. R-9]
MSEGADTRSILALSSVGKSFPGGAEALSGVSLTLRPGEFLSILGPSGCGKTTLLRIMAGLDEPTAGTIHGMVSPASAADTVPIGYVFQDPTLMPWASAWDNVFLPLRIAGAGRQAAADRVAATLDFVGLAGFADALPHQLSGGMRMRVSIARALVTQPKILLMDEPFAALDEITRFRLNDDLLRSVAATGCTVVFVTHSVYESVYLSTRIAVMTPRPGRIAAEIPVALPHGRDAALRGDPRYLAAVAAVSGALHAAMADEAERAA